MCIVTLFLHGSEMRSRNMAQLDQSKQPEQVCSARVKKYADKRKHKVQGKYISQSSSSEEDQSSVHMKRSTKTPRTPSEQDQPQHDPEPLFYRTG